MLDFHIFIFQVVYYLLCQSIIINNNRCNYDRIEESSVKGLVNSFKITYESPDNQHLISLQSEHRDYQPVEGNSGIKYKHIVSPEILNIIRPSVKNSIAYTYKKNTLDYSDVPSEGHSYSIYSELAGFGGDCRFFKQVLNLVKFIPIVPSTDEFPGVAFSLGLNCGYIKNFSPIQPLQYSDLFTVSMKGFEYCGVGPRAPIHGI